MAIFQGTRVRGELLQVVFFDPRCVASPLVTLILRLIQRSLLRKSVKHVLHPKLVAIDEIRQVLIFDKYMQH